MRRYVTAWHPLAPNGEWMDAAGNPGALQITVHEPDKQPRPTGLVDQNGTPILAIDARPAAAFVKW